MKKKILIVEDDEDIVFLLKMILEEEGYKVISASDGQMGYDSVLKEKPDLVLLDIMMPKVDGYTLNLHLKQHQETSEIPVIVITGRGHLRELFEVNRQAPIADFLEKPFPTKLLLEKIGQILSVDYAD